MKRSKRFQWTPDDFAQIMEESSKDVRFTEREKDNLRNVKSRISKSLSGADSTILRKHL